VCEVVAVLVSCGCCGVVCVVCVCVCARVIVNECARAGAARAATKEIVNPN
jgi:hypothetical protein